MMTREKELEDILHAHSLWVLSQGTRGEVANFNGWDLEGANLVSVDLPFARFQSASLKGALLSGANLRQAKLAQANLNRARLDMADLEGADISGGDLSFSECEGANFTEANLERINFQGANLEDASFNGANLRRADFKNAVLSRAEFDGANLEGANLDGAHILGNDFADANLEKTYIEKTKLKGTYLRDFNLMHAESQRAKPEGENIINLIINDEEPADTKAANHKIEKSNSNQKLHHKESKENLFVDSNVIDQNRLAEAVGDLIKKVNSSIDPNKIKTICKSQYGIEEIDKIDFDGGDIITQNDQLTFKLDYKISHKLTLFIDRQGNIKVGLP